MRINLGYQTYAIWNPGILQNAANRAFQEIIEGLDLEFKNVIQDDNAFPDFPGQDIVDTGDLLKEQRLTIVAPGQAEYRWGDDYAIFVHEGYTLRNGNQQPGRPWTKVAIERYNPRLKFAGFMLKNIVLNIR